MQPECLPHFHMHFALDQSLRTFYTTSFHAYSKYLDHIIMVLDAQDRSVCNGSQIFQRGLESGWNTLQWSGG